ncbi:hypothetical protein XI01_05545 [Bradyrhizobium sp. CCBAU 21360]|nr:hypothetical protein [Bradyrhizobium sp. CCBAU 21360]
MDRLKRGVLAATTDWLREHAKVLFIELLKHLDDAFIDRTERNVGHQLARNTEVPLDPVSLLVWSEVIACGSISMPDQRKEALDEPGCVAFYMVEPWKGGAVPNQTERGLPGLGERTGTISGSHMTCNMRIAFIREGASLEDQPSAVVRYEEAVGIALNIRRPFKGNGCSPAENLKL